MDSWLSAAVDPRVMGIIPLVYDNLNLQAQLDNHLASWGEYSPMIHDYTDLDIPSYLSSEQGADLARIVDPYTYIDRMHMPKLIVSAQTTHAGRSGLSTYTSMT